MKVIPGTKPGLQVLKTIPLSLVAGVTWSADGNFLAAFSSAHNTKPNNIVVWNKLDNYSQDGTPQTTSNSDVTALAWSPASNHYLAAGDNTGKIHVWNFYPGGNGPGHGNDLPILTLSGPQHAKVTGLAWSQDGQWLAAGFNDANDSIYVWDSSRWQG